MSIFFFVAFVIISSLIISVIIYTYKYLIRGDFRINKKIDRFLLELNSDPIWVRKLDKQWEKFGMGERILYFVMNCKETRGFISSNLNDNNINHLKLTKILYERFKKAGYDEIRERASN
jgi:hypothetical protein